MDIRAELLHDVALAIDGWQDGALRQVPDTATVALAIVEHLARRRWHFDRSRARPIMPSPLSGGASEHGDDQGSRSRPRMAPAAAATSKRVTEPPER